MCPWNYGRVLLTKIVEGIEHGRHSSQYRRNAWFGQGILDMSVDRPPCCSTNLIHRLQYGTLVRVQRETGNWTGPTFSASTSVMSWTGSADENKRWFVLISGSMSCFDMISAEALCPTKHVSHLHLNESHSRANAISCE